MKFNRTFLRENLKNRTLQPCDSYREKQSGQRWSLDGAQNIIDLRLLNINQQWSVMVDLIKTQEKEKFKDAA